MPGTQWSSANVTVSLKGLSHQKEITALRTQELLCGGRYGYQGNILQQHSGERTVAHRTIWSPAFLLGGGTGPVYAPPETPPLECTRR